MEPRVKTLCMEEYKTVPVISEKNKRDYGEVITPLPLAELVLSLFSPSILSNPKNRWLDVGAGTGSFSIVLYHLLMKHLADVIPSREERATHILKNMIWMWEFNPENCAILRELFGSDNVICGSFITQPELADGISWNIIIGNPPYNCSGLIKPPTKTTVEKADDGYMIWPDFLERALTILPDAGYLSMLIPSIWMKPDKAGVYNMLLKHHILALKTMTNTTTNRWFQGEAQTPTCYFLLQKKGEHEGYIAASAAAASSSTLLPVITSTVSTISIWDCITGRFIDYLHTMGNPIPLIGASVIQKLLLFCKKYGALSAHIIKTNLPSKHNSISDVKTATHSYPNIRTCILDGGIQPHLVINWTSAPCAFNNSRKLVLAHKMYGFPWIDASGTYGISNRDNYVICGDDLSQLKALEDFLSTRLALFVYESTRYRMKYLEKYAFDFLPDIRNVPEWREREKWASLDTAVADIFGFNETEREYIMNITKKQYGRCII